VAAIPWNPGRDYLLLLSFLPLKRWGSMPRLLLHNWRIAGQLRRANGLILP
jgi:hypothetical protein